jgi:hypothetical protein
MQHEIQPITEMRLKQVAARARKHKVVIFLFSDGQAVIRWSQGGHACSVEGSTMLTASKRAQAESKRLADLQDATP